MGNGQTSGRGTGLQIGQLNLRLPGSSAAVGQRVANGMAQRLVQQLPAGMQGQYGALNVRVEVPAGASEVEVEVAIAQSILSALQRGNTSQINAVEKGHL
ncbi:hypothetical protein IQ260_07310 [Leptolyngbya cf. ectocarpi LEGE 11479]|uniref:Uncharacterized protein n=1 Tax=Leptolyngbya cf. ectocarpi LEGE 11479 TaxID=1828722 RepID=A0A928X016_LEPEC|nr:hypothetical protein [Leptolyngbya ectocarpi]MBE9066457.1 hypothetical protein [Leptolyngbya cf. ectocarpi LEGE 11479]